MYNPMYPYLHAMPLLDKPVYVADAYIGIGEMVEKTPQPLPLPIEPKKTAKELMSEISHDYQKGLVDGQEPEIIKPNHGSGWYWIGEGLGGF